MEHTDRTIGSPRDAIGILEATANRINQGDAYVLEAIPSITDESISAVADWYRTALDEDRLALSHRIAGDVGSLLVAFSERMAVQAARARSVEPVRTGLLAIAMLPDKPTETLDHRDWIPVLALHYNSSRLAGADPLPLFDEAASFAGPSVAGTMRAYARTGEHSVEAMGYVEETTSSGLTYRRTW